ncbi:4-alpha-glucanotransferase [termite gut metagenome]|uniref:4-alpha-glucanotransferase n=1 Tax=termite gut metagenome TaxID=433724 RepID=A0A5J4T3Q2_9ZZZZ
MTLSFTIEYHTGPGEEVRITGNIPELGDKDLDKALFMQTVDDIHWAIQINIRQPLEQVIEYSYYTCRNHTVICKEWGVLPHQFRPSADSNRKYYIEDYWKDIPPQSYFYSSAFTESLLARQQKDRLPQHFPQSIIIKASVPCVARNCCLAICGNQPLLGDWNPDKALLMNNADFPEWQAVLDATRISFPLEYKFVLYNKDKQKAEAWEKGDNRCLAGLLLNSGETHVLSCQYVSFDTPPWKGAGVSIPVFSLKSESSFGIGDFSDLKKLIDWAVVTHQKIVQILPINDTTMTHTWMDSYPYNSISIYALNPVYLDLSKLGELKDEQKAAFFRQRQIELNALKAIDYEAVEHDKWEYIRLIYNQEGDKVLVSAGFKQFLETNKEWLQPYAAYSYLRDTYHTANFRNWSKYGIYNSEEIEELCSFKQEYYRQIAIYYYIQFNLHLQLSEAASYARSQGVVLKGDIPIGISRDSVEAWTEPYYFNMNGQAGAPPDDFSVTGQNWGFPTYNWDVMEKDGYRWWMKRFQKMSEYFDAYRIDHILGFFRIWEIPMHAIQGLLGQFVPALSMSCEEVESYGLPFHEELYLNPYIHEKFLQDIFGSQTEYVKETFIEPTHSQSIYRMRPDFDTQRKVETFFSGKTDANSVNIRNGLYVLISNVLFVADYKEPDRYHPRIAAQYTYIYKEALDSEAKNAFNRLYDQYYYRRHNDFWYQQAMKKLPQLIQSTRMLVCGEDLGMIPESVAWAMSNLRILSLEIQRMSKDSAYEFGHLDENPYCSVCTISTHDMSTLRGWWEENEQQTQRYYNTILKYCNPAPSVATPDICEEIVSSHLHSNSMLCIFMLQDWLSIDGSLWKTNINEERINVPANPRHYWRYRMHLTLEDLMNADDLNEKIKRLIKKAGRKN